MKKFLLSLTLITLFASLKGMEEQEKPQENLVETIQDSKVSSLVSLADQTITKMLNERYAKRNDILHCIEPYLDSIPFTLPLKLNATKFQHVVQSFDSLVKESAKDCSRINKLLELNQLDFLLRFKENSAINEVLTSKLWHRFCPVLISTPSLENKVQAFGTTTYIHFDVPNNKRSNWNLLEKNILELKKTPSGTIQPDEHGLIDGELRTCDHQGESNEIKLSGNSSNGYTVTVTGTRSDGDPMRFFLMNPFFHYIAVNGQPYYLTIKSNNNTQKQCTFNDTSNVYIQTNSDHTILAIFAPPYLTFYTGVSLEEINLNNVILCSPIVNNKIFIVDKDRNIKIFDIFKKEFRILDTIDDPAIRDYDHTFITSMKMFALLFNNNDSHTPQTALIWDIDKEKKILKIICDYGENAQLTFNNCNSMLCIYGNTKLGVWNIDTHEKIFDYQVNPTSKIYKIDFIDENYLNIQTCSSDNKKRFCTIFNISTKNLIKNFNFSGKSSSFLYGKKSLILNQESKKNRLLAQYILPNNELETDIMSCDGAQMALIYIGTRKEPLPVCTKSELFKSYQTMPERLKKLISILEYICITCVKHEQERYNALAQQ